MTQREGSLDGVFFDLRADFRQASQTLTILLLDLGNLPFVNNSRNNFRCHGQVKAPRSKVSRWEGSESETLCGRRSILRSRCREPDRFVSTFPFTFTLPSICACMLALSRLTACDGI